MKKTLSLVSANGLFALTMLLVITCGSVVQSMNLSWGLIVTEVFLIAMPTVLLLRQRRVPLREGLRLTPISPLTGGLCIVLGIALYLIALVIEGVMAQLTGLPSVSISSHLLPKTGGEMVVYFVAMAIFAPLGEELLFRGAVQDAYEREKPAWFAILVTALMFAFYHFRLSGLPALLPVALVLSYVVWRTRSIYAGMLIHFGNNGASALQSIWYFTTGRGLAFISLWSALAGFVFALAILVLLARLHPVVVKEASVEASVPAIPSSWLSTYWPLLIAGALYVGVAGLSLAATLYPQPMPSAEASYGLPVLQSPVESLYDIAHKGGQPVGEMRCRLAPEVSTLRLDCVRTIRAFEYRSGSSFYKDGNHTDALGMVWNAQTMDLLSLSSRRKYEDGSAIEAWVKEGELVSMGSSGPQGMTLTKSTLVEFEWAWHVALLKANAGQSFAVPAGYFRTWDNSQNKSTPLVKTEILRVFGDETLVLPQGETVVRKVSLAGWAAWYAKADAMVGLPRPVRFDDGMLIYTLAK